MSEERPKGPEHEADEERLRRPEDEIKDLEVADEAEAVRGGIKIDGVDPESGDSKHGPDW